MQNNACLSMNATLKGLHAIFADFCPSAFSEAVTRRASQVVLISEIGGFSQAQGEGVCSLVRAASAGAQLQIVSG